MWHLRSVVVLGVVVGALFFGSAVVHGFWWWNGRINVEGTHITVNWGVEAPGVKAFDADITVTLPEEAEARIIKVAPNEDIKLEESAALSCLADAIEATVEFEVSADDGEAGSAVQVAVKAGRRDILGQANGVVGEVIHLDVLIPGTCSD